MEKIAKLNPQPTEHGIFSRGTTTAEGLTTDGRSISWDEWEKLTPPLTPVWGVWLAEAVYEGDTFYTKEGRFVRCPEGISESDLWSGVSVKLIDGEWWWVRG